MVAYLSAALVVVVFLFGYDVWAVLGSMLGRDGAAFVPVAAAVLVPICAILTLRARLTRWGLGQWLALVGCAALIAAALLLCDGDFPAKRTHVVEYVLVSLLVRKGACRHAGSWALTISTLVIASLFGIHDELAQGLHPQRTFGLPDIEVDVLAASAGALLGHGVGLFQGGADSGRPEMGVWAFATGALGLGVGLMVVGLWATGVRLPDLSLAPPPHLWTVAPVLGGGIALLVVDWPERPWLRHLLEMSVALALSMPLYLVMPHVTSLVFR